MKLLIAGLAAVALAAPASIAFAADAPAAAMSSSMAMAPVAAAAGKPSVETTPINDLLAKPESKAVLEAELPGISTHPQLASFGGMTLKAVEPMSNGIITDDKLNSIQSKLNALP